MPYILKVDRKKFAKALALIKDLGISPVHMRKIFTYLAATKLGLVDDKVKKQIEKDITKAELAPLESILNIPMNSGDLNYFFTEVMVIYIDQNRKKYGVLETLAGVLDKAKSEVKKYHKASDLNLPEEERELLELVLRGLFNCCSDELYRVITGPYEDEKMSDPANGPVVEDLATLGRTKDY